MPDRKDFEFPVGVQRRGSNMLCEKKRQKNDVSYVLSRPITMKTLFMRQMAALLHEY